MFSLHMKGYICTYATLHHNSQIWLLTLILDFLWTKNDHIIAWLFQKWGCHQCWELEAAGNIARSSKRFWVQVALLVFSRVTLIMISKPENGWRRSVGGGYWWWSWRGSINEEEKRWNERMGKEWVSEWLIKTKTSRVASFSSSCAITESAESTRIL